MTTKQIIEAWERGVEPYIPQRNINVVLSVWRKLAMRGAK